jgi:signal transduction histidine kinase
LRYEGPDALTVVGDAVKTRRIAQNLVLNAVKYTHRGGVIVTCGKGSAKDAARWFFTVNDTGPGFDAGPGSELAGALEVATEQSRQVNADSRTGTVTHADTASNVPAATRSDVRAPPQQQPGEGIGLSIVKRLCELLNASVEMESTAGMGTAFRILLPLSYSD